MRRSSAADGALVALAAASLLTATVSAHRRDEYLQAARIAVEPARVDLELDLTPGIALADAIIADIDQDADGAFSSAEQGGYIGRVLGALTLQVDGRPLAVQLVSATFPDLDAVRRGEGMIRIRASASLPQLNAGTHHLLFRNAHRPEVSVYLANALVPRSDRVAVTTQRRDGIQSELVIDYELNSAGSAPAFSPVWVGLVWVGLAGVVLWRLSRRAE